MLSQIYLQIRGKDSRAEKYLKDWRKLRFRGISKLEILDVYTITGNLKRGSILKVAKALTNQKVEHYFINGLLGSVKFTYAIEVGYLPGVTDNIGNTSGEIARDLLGKKGGIEIFSSRVFLISGKINYERAEAIAASLYNPLIERAQIFKFRKNFSLPKVAPKVKLSKERVVLQVPLAVAHDELEKIGKEGVLGQDGKRRGPLALDLVSMKAIQRYFNKLGRDPSDIELESLAQTWSEHCKHTIFASPIDEIKEGLYKTYIKGATNLIRKKKRLAQRSLGGVGDICLSVFSDNSGGIVFDNKYLITHKVETHNTPSALDPFGGAVTGIVGVNRDTIGFGLGAKPIANTYGFCFGLPEDKRPLFRNKERTQKMFPPSRIMEGVIRGINFGGNTSGIPTLSGFIRFDERYRGKPLVFAGTVGLMPRRNSEQLLYKKRARKGDLIVMVGGRVGRDGIHGATFSSVTMDSKSPAGAVQIGDPITQKKLSDAVVKEARDRNLYSSITDNGAGGLSCSVAEMAKESGGAKVDLEKVPLKYPNLESWEIWISESQERMTLAVPPRKWKKLKALLANRGVEASVIGTFTDSRKCVVRWHGRTIMNIEMELLHNGWPRRQQRTRKPKVKYLKLKKRNLEDFLSEKNVGGYAFISEQYDHEVQAGSVIKPLSGPGRINTDAQVFRPILTSTKGVVLSYGIYPQFSERSPYDMAAMAIDTAIRGAIAAGGKLEHLALLDNFCWCSSYDPHRLWQLKEAARACYDLAVAYSTPFISGKDSMFNDFRGFDKRGRPVEISIPPTLLISSIGVMPNINKAVTPEFKSPGDIIYLLGRTIAEKIPKVNTKENIRIYRALEKAIDKELLASSISVTTGGLAVALAKAAIGGMLGAKAKTSGHNPFSESQGRVLVSVAPDSALGLEKLIKNIPHTKIGVVTKSGQLKIDKKFYPIKKLHRLYHQFSNSMK